MERQVEALKRGMAVMKSEMEKMRIAHEREILSMRGPEYDEFKIWKRQSAIDNFCKKYDSGQVGHHGKDFTTQRFETAEQRLGGNWLECDL